VKATLTLEVSTCLYHDQICHAVLAFAGHADQDLLSVHGLVVEEEAETYGNES